MKRRLPWFGAALGLAVAVYALSPPALRFLGEQLVHSDPLERVDAIVVLASGLDRVVEAADLYRAGYAPVVVLTTDPPEPVTVYLRNAGIEALSSEEHRRQILHALGVPLASIVVLDDVVRSTADEARVFERWSSARGIRSALIVTSPAHTARSRLTFRRLLAERQIRLLVRPSRLAPFRSDTWWHSRDTLREGVLEWQKLVYYVFFER